MHVLYCSGRIYGNQAMNSCFSESHWNENQGWQWNKKDGRFLTPSTRQRDANLRFDPNLAIEKLARMDSLAIANEKNKTPVNIAKSTPKKKKRSRKNKKGKQQQEEVKDDDSATYNDPLKVKEKTLLRKVMDHDDDSQIHHGSAGHVNKSLLYMP